RAKLWLDRGGPNMKNLWIYGASSGKGNLPRREVSFRTASQSRPTGTPWYGVERSKCATLAMSTLTKVRDAIWHAWQRDAVKQGATPPAKFWAESAAYAVIDHCKEASRKNDRDGDGKR